MKALHKLFFFVFIYLLFGCSNITENTQVYPELAYIPSTEDTQLVVLLNNYHLTNNLPPLVYSAHMSALAAGHNDHMILTNTLDLYGFHDRCLSIQYVLHLNGGIGECLAYNYQNPASVLSAWINSPDHKVILDKPSTHVGLAITIGTNNKKYITAIFAD